MTFGEALRLRAIQLAWKAFGGNSLTFNPFQGAFRGTIGTTRSRLWDNQDPAAALKESEFLAISVFRIAEAVMFAEWEIYDERTNEPVDEGHNAVALFQKPNRFMYWHDLLEIATIHMLTTKGGFIVETQISALGNPIELWPFYPSFMWPIKDPNKFIDHWEYRLAGHIQKIPVDRVHRLKFAHPTDMWNGLGRVEAMEHLLNTDIAMTQYTENYFANMGMPGQVIEADGATGEQTQAIKDTVDQMHGGFWNAFKTLVLPKGVKLNRAQDSPKEVDFIQSKERAGKSIAAIFGVGPMMMGRAENSNRATAALELLMFQRLVLKPILKRLTNPFDEMVKKFDRRIGFRFKPVADEDVELESQIDNVDILNGSLTRNERRVRRGLAPSKEQGMDSFLVPQNLVPIEQASEEPGTIPPGLAPFIGQPKPGAVPGEPKPTAGNPDANSPKPAEPGVAPAPADQTTDAGGGQTAGGGAQGDAGARSVKAVESKGRWKRSAQMRLHKFASKQRAHSVRTVSPRLRQFFTRQADRMAHRMRHGSRDLAAGYLKECKELREAKTSASDLLGFSEFRADYAKLTRRFFVEALQQDFDATAEFIGLDASFGPDNADFNARIDRLAQSVTLVDQETRDRLEEVIRQGTELGLTPTQIADGVPELGFDGIRGTVEGWSDSRTDMIAATESSRVYDQASVEAYDQSGVQTCDVVGCEDDEIMPGEDYGCSSRNIPIGDASDINFHPRHRGTIVPSLVGLAAPALRILVRALSRV